MSNKHTPGPWIIQDDNENPHNAIVVDSRTESKVIAGPFSRVGENMANAQLIAAAPELLRDKERLDWLSQCTAGEWEELQDIRLSKPLGYLRIAIDIAISKTTGQAS